MHFSIITPSYPHISFQYKYISTHMSQQSRYTYKQIVTQTETTKQYLGLL